MSRSRSDHYWGVAVLLVVSFVGCAVLVALAGPLGLVPLPPVLVAVARLAAVLADRR
jgi:hypothetical protein